MRVPKISCFWWLSHHLEHSQPQVCSSMWHSSYSPELEGKTCPLNTGSSHSLHTSYPAQVSGSFLEKKRLGVLSLANNESSRSWFRRMRRPRNKEKTEVNESVEIVNEKKTPNNKAKLTPVWKTKNKCSWNLSIWKKEKITPKNSCPQPAPIWDYRHSKRNNFNSRML